MDLSTLYALVAGSIFVLLWLVQVISKSIRFLSVTVQILRRHIVYPHLIRRYTITGPLTRSRFSLVMVVVGVNAFFCVFRASTTAEIGVRTGDMALVNLIPLYLGIHHSFVADLLGLRLQFYQFLHASAATVCIVQAAVHAIVEGRRSHKLSFVDDKQLYGWIVSYNLREKTYLTYSLGNDSVGSYDATDSPGMLKIFL